jgi:hypothetical protein
METEAKVVGRVPDIGALGWQTGAVDPGALVAAVALSVVSLTTVALALLVERQPRRWVAFYALFFLAALATAIRFGTGGLDWVVTAQVLGLMAGLGLVSACLGDGFPPQVRRIVSLIVTVLTLLGAGWVVVTSSSGGSPVGSVDGVRLATAVFLAQVTVAGVLLTVGYVAMPARAVPLLPALGITAVLATGLWVMPADMEIRGLEVHDLAMLVSASCLLLLWGLNQLRFNRREFIVVEVSR